jgi:hypothetical protein
MNQRQDILCNSAIQSALQVKKKKKKIEQKDEIFVYLLFFIEYVTQCFL